MASTFNGKILSKNGFEQISVAAVTGAITTNFDIDSSGNTTTTGTLGVTGVTSATGGVVIGAASSLQLIGVTATTATIAVTDDTNTIVTIAQPAGTILKDLIAWPAGNIVTAGSSGNDLDISIGTASAGAQLLAATAILDDGGAGQLTCRCTLLKTLTVKQLMLLLPQVLVLRVVRLLQKLLLLQQLYIAQPQETFLLLCVQ